MNARRVLIVCILVVLLALMACKGDPVKWKPTEGSPADPAFATATYGAEQWQAQLTALAETPEE